MLTPKCKLPKDFLYFQIYFGRSTIDKFNYLTLINTASL